MATAVKRKQRRNGGSDVAGAANDLQHDFEALRSDLNTLAQEVTSLVGNTSDEAVQELKDRIRRIRDNLDETVSDATSRGRDALRDMSDNFTESVEEQLRERPLTTVALAAGIGFVVGAIWRR
ncbi:MAG: DUF883 family protein [Bradyrhizobium sp.]|uniref:DUF883 family protein n=1 Tax=Bradyrhizobium sp. TaxID=376 RepID=UPI001E0789AD|nr:DUF883 family protein [Bradyrhizobium sp.]MBV9560306.1 DUF883 family protein [Bradyrhizobium sp.]